MFDSLRALASANLKKIVRQRQLALQHIHVEEWAKIEPHFGESGGT
jgi:hypothetical protein